MRPRFIHPARGALAARIRASPSKSVTHRALVAAALAQGPSRIVDPLDADDTRATAQGLRELGVVVEFGAGAWNVEGVGRAIPGGGSLWLEDSGTSLRFLTAVACLGARPSRLDGSSRLRERPLEELAEALRTLGGRVRLPDGVGGLPLEAGGTARLRGGRIRIPSGRSSQFASALMLVGSRLSGGLDLTLEPDAVSVPYIEITERVLLDFGVDVERVDRFRFKVAEGDSRGRTYSVEGDHSSASYFLAAAAIVGGKVRVDGLTARSPQPDARLAGVLRGLGCRVEDGEDWIEVEGGGTLSGFDLEMSGAPDLVPTLAVLGLFADGPSVVRGIAHLRHKESDRLELLARNLTALGRPTSVRDDRLEIGPLPADGLRGSLVETRSDHRMAMAFAVAGLRLSDIRIDDADCVAKSNPRFWQQFESLAGG